jgi:hypothetical protein
MAARQTSRIFRLLRAGSTITAMNIAYSATPAALSSTSGNSAPSAAPRKVPSTQQGMLTSIMP